MNDKIQGWASIVLGAAVILFVGWLSLEQFGPPRIRRDVDAGVSAASGSASVSVSPSASAGASASAGDDAAAPLTLGGMALDTDGGFASLTIDGGAMPTGAPRAVRLGVVLVQWAGAEGASSSARAKPDALKHAQSLLDQAHTDWKAAVKAGDSGSSEDIGRVPRGVLDARTEVAVFSLGKDEISEPLETPRGYWIVKRVE